MEIWSIAIDVGMLLAGIITGAIYFLRKGYAKSCGFVWKNKPDFPADFSWDVHSAIHETLTELRVQTDSARTQLVQFHNGGEFIDGISMKKMSLTHESLTRGVSSEMPTKQDIPITMCVAGLGLLKSDKPVIHITEELEESWCKNYYQNTNTIAFSMLPVKMKNNIVGYVMCQWCSWNKTDIIDEDSISKELEDARVLIEVQLGHQIMSKKKK
jgi:hypothetical protein